MAGAQAAAAAALAAATTTAAACPLPPYFLLSKYEWLQQQLQHNVYYNNFSNK